MEPEGRIAKARGPLPPHPSFSPPWPSRRRRPPPPPPPPQPRSPALVSSLKFPPHPIASRPAGIDTSSHARLPPLIPSPPLPPPPPPSSIKEAADFDLGVAARSLGRWVTLATTAWRRCAATSTAASTTRSSPSTSSSPSGPDSSTSSRYGSRKRRQPPAPPPLVSSLRFYPRSSSLLCSMRDARDCLC